MKPLVKTIAKYLASVFLLRLFNKYVGKRETKREGMQYLQGSSTYVDL
jgi:hypothetical protein